MEQQVVVKKKDRAAIEDGLEVVSSHPGEERPAHAITMPGGRLPTVAEIQAMFGVDDARAQQILEGYR